MLPDFSEELKNLAGFCNLIFTSRVYKIFKCILRKLSPVSYCFLCCVIAGHTKEYVKKEKDTPRPGGDQQ